MVLDTDPTSQTRSGARARKRGDVAFGDGIAVILQHLQVIATDDFGNLLPPLDRHPPGRGVLRLGGQAEDLRAVAAAGGLQCSGDNAVFVDLDRNHLGAGGAGGIAKAGIGQFLDQDDGTVAAQAAVEDEANGILPAMGKCDILGTDGAKEAVAHPADDLGPQGGFALLAGIVEPPLPRGPGHGQEGSAERIGLTNLGHLRRAQVSQAGGAAGDPFGIQCLGRPQPRRLCGHKGAAPDGGGQKPFLRRQLVGARHGSGGQMQAPGQITDCWKLGIRGQLAGPNGIAQGARETQILRAGKLTQIGRPTCISHNNPLATHSAALLQYIYDINAIVSIQIEGGTNAPQPDRDHFPWRYDQPAPAPAHNICRCFHPPSRSPASGAP
jgi:hypothetical protein